MSEPTTRELTYEGDARGPRHGDVWWYFRASDTGLLIGVENARLEADWHVNEDGTGSQFYEWEWDELVIAEGHPTWPGTLLPHRPMTDEECDEYADDIRDVLDVLRASEF